MTKNNNSPKGRKYICEIVTADKILDQHITENVALKNAFADKIYTRIKTKNVFV